MIEALALHKQFRSVTAVHDLSFTVGDGEIFGLLGPNGAGKTTSVRMLSGLIAPTSGGARVNGMELGRESQRIRAITGVLTETPGLHDKLTARANLGYYGRLYGLRGATLRRAVDRYLGVVGLADEADRRVGGFSKGMRQKVAIARALLHEPDVIYLDEPTSALDPSAAKTVRDFVATLRDAGRSIVVCTHNLDEAERLCDRIGIMRGTLLQVDTPAGLRRRNGSASVRVELVGARHACVVPGSPRRPAVRRGRPRGRRGARRRGARPARRQSGPRAGAGRRRGAHRRRPRGRRDPRAGVPRPRGRGGHPGWAAGRAGGGGLMRIGYIWAVITKEAADLLANRLLLAAVVFPALVFAAIPTAIVAFIEVNDLDPNQMGEIERYISQFPDLDPKRAAQAFIVLNFMAYFLLIPAMVPMAIATQSVVGEKTARSLEPQLATPMEVSELISGKAVASAVPAVLATWAVYLLYGIVNGAITDPVMTRLIFNDTWRVAMLTLVPLICLLSVLLGIIVSSRVTDARTAQQIGGFIVIPVIAIAVAGFFSGQATFTLEQVLIGDLVVAGLIGIALVAGNWIFDRESILTRLG